MARGVPLHGGGASPRPHPTSRHSAGRSLQQGGAALPGEYDVLLLNPGDVVILVHGTFAQGARWIESDEALANALRLHVPGIDVVPFRWSGSNSHRARVSASHELADLICRANPRSTDNGAHIIAHSHDGNVAPFLEH